jgi:hypothetical protein
VIKVHIPEIEFPEFPPLGNAPCKERGDLCPGPPPPGMPAMPPVPRTPTNARSRQRTAAPPTSTTSVSMRKLSGALLGILGGRHASALNITVQEYADATCSRHATVCGADADVAAGADAFAWQPHCTPKLLISHVYWRCCDLCGRLSHLFGGASASSLQTAARAQALA